MCSSRSASTFSRMVFRFFRLLFSTRSLLSSELMSSSCSPMSFILAFCRGAGGRHTDAHNQALYCGASPHHCEASPHQRGASPTDGVGQAVHKQLLRCSCRRANRKRRGVAPKPAWRRQGTARAHLALAEPLLRPPVLLLHRSRTLLCRLLAAATAATTAAAAVARVARAAVAGGAWPSRGRPTQHGIRQLDGGEEVGSGGLQAHTKKTMGGQQVERQRTAVKNKQLRSRVGSAAAAAAAVTASKAGLPSLTKLC